MFPNAITADCDPTCWKYLAVHRISFGLVLYHSFWVIFTFQVKKANDPRGIFHNG